MLASSAISVKQQPISTEQTDTLTADRSAADRKGHLRTNRGWKLQKLPPHDFLNQNSKQTNKQTIRNNGNATIRLSLYQCHVCLVSRPHLHRQFDVLSPAITARINPVSRNTHQHQLSLVSCFHLHRHFEVSERQQLVPILLRQHSSCI